MSAPEQKEVRRRSVVAALQLTLLTLLALLTLRVSAAECGGDGSCSNTLVRPHAPPRPLLAPQTANPTPQRQQTGIAKLRRHKSVVALAERALTVVVVGASGHLARTKTYPALYALFKYGLLPESARIVGFARSAYERDAFHDKLRPTLKGGSDEQLAGFLGRCHYFSGQYDSVEAFERLDETLLSLEGGPSNRVFYFAIPPTVFAAAGAGLKAGAMTSTGWNRMIIEKPFGRDSASSAELSAQLKQHFEEEQLYRIDHYLGKEMVQNMLVLRFANAVFEPLWNNKYVANVMITFKERDGVEGRGGYFDQFGIIRDVMQNHLMQILALVAMEPPASLGAEDIRDEKVKALRAIRPLRPEDVIVGQYSAAEGKVGYAEDPSVPDGSTTPTFAQAVFRVRNPRWEGVPFILKCGKGLDERKAEIRIQFKPFPGPRFPLEGDDDADESLEALARADSGGGGGGGDDDDAAAFRRAQERDDRAAHGPINELVMRVQPDEAIYLKMATKSPGLSEAVRQSELNLSYGSRFGVGKLPDAYERLILDVLRGDHHLFVRDDELRFAWELFTPVLHHLERDGAERPLQYPIYGRGPPEADERCRELGVRRYTNYQWEKEHPGESKL